MTLMQFERPREELLSALPLPPAIKKSVLDKSASRSRDFLSRFVMTEQMKNLLRENYYHAIRQTRNEPRESFLARSRSFWEEYEDINRVYLPDDPVYSGTRSSVTLATTADLWTLSSPASGQIRVLESYVGGEATTSTVVRIAVQRTPTGTTPTNQTPEKFNTRSPAAASTFATTWSTQPVPAGAALLYHSFNAFGGTDRWVPSPGSEIYLVNAEVLSCRSGSGTPIVSAHVIWEEL